MKGLRTQVEIAGTKVSVPIVGDTLTTQRIAQQVSAHIRNLENETRRIDTQAFAPEAAVYFAAKLHEAREERGADVAEAASALSDLAANLSRLARDYRVESK